MRIIIFTLLSCSAQGKECRDRRGQPRMDETKYSPATLLLSCDEELHAKGQRQHSVNCAGHLQASAIPEFNPTSWSSQEKGFWMPGWQEEWWVSGGMGCEQLCVVPVCVLTGHWQYQPPVGEASSVSALFLCLAMPTRSLVPWRLG